MMMCLTANKSPFKAVGKYQKELKNLIRYVISKDFLLWRLLLNTSILTNTAGK